MHVSKLYEKAKQPLKTARAVQILFALAILFSFPKVSYCRGWVINKLQTYSVRNQVFLLMLNSESSI